MTEISESAPQGHGRTSWGELGFAVLLLAVAVVVLVDAAGLPASRTASGVGPGFFPAIVGTVLAVIAAALIVQVLRGRYGTPEQGEGDVDPSSTRIRAALLVVGCVIAHGVLLDLAGFVVAAFVAFWGIAFALGARHRLRDPAIALGTALVIYLGFTRGLGIDLPAGVLGGIV